MSKFTPGPWVADHFDEGDWLVRAHGTETILAESPAGIHGLSIGESHAICNLIAAAPDMYAALEEIARADIIAHSTGKYSLAVEACAEAARAAIDKATTP